MRNFADVNFFSNNSKVENVLVQWQDSTSFSRSLKIQTKIGVSVVLKVYLQITLKWNSRPNILTITKHTVHASFRNYQLMLAQYGIYCFIFM